MKRWFRILPVVAALASCDDRYNLHGHLVKEPSPADIAGTYRFDSGSPDQGALKEMGYKAIDSTLTLKPDFTFTTTGVPGCCVHGWDERTYPFTGGVFEFSGTWRVSKSGTTYGVGLDITKMTGEAEKELSTADPATERKPPSSLHADLLEDTPIAVGFRIFDGDFGHIAYRKASPQDD